MQAPTSCFTQDGEDQNFIACLATIKKTSGELKVKATTGASRKSLFPIPRASRRRRRHGGCDMAVPWNQVWSIRDGQGHHDGGRRYGNPAVLWFITRFRRRHEDEKVNVIRHA